MWSHKRILRQLQENFSPKKKNRYFAFVDLEKAFDQVLKDVVQWTLRKTRVEEWLVNIVQTMYKMLEVVLGSVALSLIISWFRHDYIKTQY